MDSLPTGNFKSYSLSKHSVSKLTGTWRYDIRFGSRHSHLTLSELHLSLGAPQWAKVMAEPPLGSSGWATWHTSSDSLACRRSNCCFLSLHSHTSSQHKSCATTTETLIRFCGVGEFANGLDLCGNQLYYSRMWAGVWGVRWKVIGWASISGKARQSICEI